MAQTLYLSHVCCRYAGMSIWTWSRASEAGQTFLGERTFAPYFNNEICPLGSAPGSSNATLP